MLWRRQARGVAGRSNPAEDGVGGGRCLGVGPGVPLFAKQGSILAIEKAERSHDTVIQ